MNRKEFTNLLLEWRKNFVNERSINTASVSGKEMSDLQKDFVNEVPFNLHLYAIGDFIVNYKNHPMPISYVLIKLLSAKKSPGSSVKKSPKSIILEKEDLNDLINVLQSLLSKTNFSYDDIDGNIIDNSKNSKLIQRNLNNLKEDLSNIVNDDSGILLYFPRMTSTPANMSDGSINNIGSIKDPGIWKNALFWELKHDVFHYIEEVLKKENSNKLERLDDICSKNDRIREIINNFDVPDQHYKAEDPSIIFSSSLGDGDNFATVATYIRSLDKNEFVSKLLFLSQCRVISRNISPDKSNPESWKLTENEEALLEEFFDLVHLCYEDAEEFLKDKILIQRSHG